MDVLPYDTKDEAGGERYMPFEPGHHLTYMPPKNPKDDWYSNYSVDVKWGIDHCAAKSVAFHYINSDLMRRMHAILYHQCGHGAKLPPTIDKPVTKVNEEQKLAPQKAEQKVQDEQVAAIAVIEKAQDNVKAVKSIEQQEAEQKLRDDKVAAKAAPVKHDKDLVAKKESDTAKIPHLYPYFPPMPPHIMAEDLFGKEIITDTLAHNKPTIAGIIAILQRFLRDLHQLLVDNRDSTAHVVVEKYFALVDKDLAPLDAAYRDKPIFPIREDGSIFMSLGAYRDHLLGETLRQAFHYAANPDKLYVGAVVQNCFGIDVQCRTGVEVKGTDKNGNPITAISDRPPDPNGIEEFCGDPDYKKYCDSGQIRVLYVNETESNGPTTARYFASKLWGGETYYMQSDAHLRFAQDWDRYFHEEVLTAKLYPKAILSSYPPGFSDGDPPYKGGSIGERLCTCEFSSSDVEDHIIRINTGNHCKGEEAAPTQIAYIAAGFFFTRAEFLTEIPFDPYLPWCFMGEEIALSLRAWTHGWGIYAPRKNVFAHQYRPGRMGLPKFWENTGRVFGRPGPGFNTELQKITLQRIKHMVTYKESDDESLQQQDIQVILTDYEHYGPGDVRTTQAFLDHNKIDMQTQKCGWNEYCNECTLP